MRDLRRRYAVYVQLGLLLSLGLVITAFSVPLRLGGNVEIFLTPNEAIMPTEIESTEHPKEPPPPPRPPAPVEVENVEAADISIDLPSLERTIETTLPLPPLPAPPVEEEPEAEPEPEIFVIVENPPELIGGLDGLQQRIQYPELARRAGIEGTVFVQFVVDENGNVVDPVCVRDPGGNTCEEALRAVRASKFEPGRQRGRPVKVRFSLPVRFRLQ